MLINTMKQLEDVKPKLLACVNPAVDTETTGTKMFGKDKDMVIGISIDIESDAYYFPFRHMQGINLPIEAMDFFKSYLSNSDRVFMGWNYKFDEHALYNDGIEFAPNYEDIMLGLHLLNENEPNFQLKDTADRYNVGNGSLEESILKEKVIQTCHAMNIPVSEAKNSPINYKSKMYVLPPEDVEPYACDDVRLTRGLADLIKPALKYHGLYDIWKQVNYYSYITGRMEQYGMHVDTNIIFNYQNEAVTKSQEALDQLNLFAGHEINPNSPKQVCAFLGTSSSASDILDDLIDAGGEQSERAKLIRNARGWSSVNSRYYTPYMHDIDENGNIHSNLNLMGTISGRLSCTNPNLQAVAKKTDVFKVKDVFTAREGFTIIQADYKQAEMRLATFYAQEETMADLIRKGADLHSATAEMLNIPRTAAKRINFGVIYGIGADALSRQLRVDRSIAKGYLDRYHKLYPGFRRLMKACENEAESKRVIHMWTGRMRHFNVEEAYTHKAMSNLIQGGVAEIMRVTISKIYPAVCDLGGHLMMQVHDSLMMEIPDENVDIALKTVKSIMEDFTFDPRMEVDIEYGKSWGSLQEWNPESEVV